MNDPQDQFRPIVRMVEDAQRAFSAVNLVADQIAQSSAFLTTHRSGLASAILELQRRREMLEPNLSIQRLTSQMQAAQQLANQLGSQFHSSIKLLDDQAKIWRHAVEPAILQVRSLQMSTKHLAGLADSIVVWESCTSRLAHRIGEIGLIQQHASLAQRLFVSSEVFTDFAQTTLARIQNAGSDRQAWALETSLRLAEEQLISTTDLLDAVVILPEDTDEVSPSRELRSLYVQQDELLEAVEDIQSEDETTLIDASQATSAVDLSRNLLLTITTCNEARKASGMEEIFKPTTRLLEVYAEMPWLISTSKKSFSEFVDCLYFLFYEGAGKDHLRFLKAEGGPIDDADFEFILCIKHLRNKWTRHDPDHGQQKAIEKSWAELAAKFKLLGLAHMPVTAEDFRLLHLKLLAQAYAFANKILSGIVR